jgi:hypothetical protein
VACIVPGGGWQQGGGGISGPCRTEFPGMQSNTNFCFLAQNKYLERMENP